MQFILILILGILYPLTHVLNGKLFAFAEITPHIGLIYLPAFLRLFNVLVLKPRDGTLATLLGGVLLMGVFDNSTLIELLNIVCSTGGPLIALYLFKLYYKRDVNLTSPTDLAALTFMYAPANALLHHVMWSQLDPSQLESPLQVLWMIVGDIAGTLIAAYALIGFVRLYRLFRPE
jgi:hypothetical protein